MNYIYHAWITNYILKLNQFLSCHCKSMFAYKCRIQIAFPFFLCSMTTIWSTPNSNWWFLSFCFAWMSQCFEHLRVYVIESVWVQLFLFGHTHTLLSDCPCALLLLFLTCLILLDVYYAFFFADICVAGPRGESKEFGTLTSFLYPHSQSAPSFFSSLLLFPLHLLLRDNWDKNQPLNCGIRQSEENLTADHQFGSVEKNQV